MINKDQTDYLFIYDYLSIHGKDISRFLRDVCRSFEPETILGQETFFDEDSFEEIEQLDFRSKSESINGTDSSIFNISPFFQNRLTPRGTWVEINSFYKESPFSDNEVMHLLSMGKFKIGFMMNTMYNFLQSEDNPQRYHKSWGLDSTGLPMYFNERLQLDRIDISNNPGRHVYLHGMKFVPGYKIWYGVETIELFGGRDKILGYPHAVYAKELSNGVIEMQLMDSIKDSDNAINQFKQMDIKQYLGLDKLEVSKYS